MNTAPGQKNTLSWMTYPPIVSCQLSGRMEFSDRRNIFRRIIFQTLIIRVLPRLEGFVVTINRERVPKIYDAKKKRATLGKRNLDIHDIY